ncbi:MAG: hypothetical protein ACI32H_06115 [Bacilli bacterium]
MTYRIQKVHDLIDETDIAWNMFLNYLQSSNYFKLFNIMDEKERRYYINKMCSDLAVICEKYSKALYLKTASIPESIINRLNSTYDDLNLTDDDVVNIIIGSDDARTRTIYGQLTREEKRQIQELKFHGIGHNFTKLFDSNNYFLKNIQFYFNPSMKDLKNVSDSDLEDMLYSDKVYDAFVKGRYSSLNDYDADFDALISLCEILQSLITKGESFPDMDCVEILTEINSDLISDFYNYKESIVGHTSIYGGYQPRFRTIKHIYPILGSKISVENKESKKEYHFGEHKSVSLFKFVDINGVNQRVKKSREELLSDVEKAFAHVGLYSAVDGANIIMELNDAFSLSGLTIEDGGFVIFEDNNGLHSISNIDGQLILTKYELIKKENDDKKLAR